MDVNYLQAAQSDLLQEIAALKARQLVLERDLQEAAELGRRVMLNSGDCIKILDLDGNLNFMNEPGQRLMGVTDFDAIRGCPWTGLWAGPQQTLAERALMSALSGQSVQFQGAAKTLAGIDKLWEVHLSPMLDAAGRPEKILSVPRDLTAVKHGEDAVLLNALIMKASPDCIVVLDLEGNIQFVSPGGIESMEIMDPSAILGRSWLLGWPEPTHRTAATAAVGQARAGGVARFEGFRPTYENTPKWWDIIISALLGPDGLPIRLVSIGRDITARKRAEQRDADSAERLRSALSASETIGTYDWDLTTHLVYADTNLARLFGIDPAPAAQGLPSDVFIGKIHPDDRALFEDAVANLVAHGGNYDCEFRICTPAGITRWIQAHGRPVSHIDGRPTRIAGANVDITQHKRDTELLREAELRMRLAQEAAGIGTFETLAESDEFIASDQFFRLFGLPTFIRAPVALVTGLILPEDRAKLSTYETRRAGVALPHAEYRIRRADTGELRWIEREAMLQPNAPGGPCRMVGIARDVTGQKAAAQRQTALVELGGRLRNLQSTAQIAAAAAAILGPALNVARAGYGSAGAGSRTIHVEQDWCAAPAIRSIEGPHDCAVYGTFIDDLLRGEPVMLRNIDAECTPRMAARLRDLQIKALLNIPVLEQGRLVAVWFVHDTTARGWTDQEVAFLKTVADRVWAAMEQVRAAAELRLLNETLEAQVADRTRERDQAWKNSQDLQLVATSDGCIRAANAAWTTLLGWRPEDIIGVSFLDFIHPSDIKAGQEALAAVWASPLPPHETRYRHSDGSYCWISWVAAAENGLIYGSGRHVTAEKQAAIAMQAVEAQLRQAQKMEAVGQLTGGLAHDFNNMLTGISGSLELLQLRVAQGRYAEIDPYIVTAQSGAKRAAALTHRLLAFSRQQTLEPKRTNINLLVREMHDLLTMTAGSQVRIDVVGDPALWTTLVDPNQLENVLLNLVINARDAMPDGGRVIIRLDNRQIEDEMAQACGLTPGAYVCLSVTDTGMGMTPEVIARVFDPFYTTKPMGQGTGLGLSMIYGFVQQSGGRVHVRSAPGQGTTMSLYLPRDEGTERIAPPPPPEEAPTTQPKTILVVDDEPNIRMLVVEVLRSRGYIAIEAAEAASALKLLRSSVPIDLMVTDVGLPGGMNGRQLADIARVLRAGLKVLFVTGYAETAMVADASMPPGMEILAKPFRLLELAKRINRLITHDADSPVTGIEAQA